jgi:hypothetical protein
MIHTSGRAANENEWFQNRKLPGWLAGVLMRAAAQIAPDLASRGPFQLSIEELLKIIGHHPLDPPAVREEPAEVRRSALDPIWRNAEQELEGMIPLRDHMMRLCGVAEELGSRLIKSTIQE